MSTNADWNEDYDDGNGPIPAAASSTISGEGGTTTTTTHNNHRGGEEEDDAEEVNGHRQKRRRRRRENSSPPVSSSSSGSVGEYEYSVVPVTIAANPEAEEEGATVPLGYESIRKRIKKSDTACHLCTYEFGPCDPTLYPERAKLFAFMQRNKGMMSDDELARQLVQYYDTLVRGPLIQAGEECPTWTVEMVAIHLQRHLNDGKSAILDQVEMMRVMRAEVANFAFKRNELGNQVVCDHEAHKLVIAYSKREMELLKEDPEKFIVLKR